MPLTLTNVQQTKVQLVFLDAKGEPAQAENVTLESNNPNVLTIESLGDAAFKLVAGVSGMAQITATADARIGEGEKAITGADDITVVASEAAIITFQFEAPQDQ